MVPIKTLIKSNIKNIPEQKSFLYNSSAVYLYSICKSLKTYM